MIALRPCGSTSIVDTSISPNNDIASVLGIGVALISRKSTLSPSATVFSLFYAKAMLLIGNDQSQIIKIDIFLKQGMRAYDNIDLVMHQPFQDPLFFLPFKAEYSTSTSTS